MDASRRFCAAVGAILITAVIPVLVLPLRFTASGTVGYICIALLAIGIAAVWSVPDEDFL